MMPATCPIIESTVVSVGLLLLLAVSLWLDVRTRRIPNTLLFPVMTSGLICQSMGGQGWSALAGVAFAFALTLPPVLVRGMGMGDQKLLMAVGAWSSASDVYQLFLGSIIAGLAWLLLTPWKWQSTWRSLHVLAVGWHAHQAVWLPTKENSAFAMPYAVCLFVAYLYGLLEGRYAG